MFGRKRINKLKEQIHDLERQNQHMYKELIDYKREVAPELQNLRTMRINDELFVQTLHKRVELLEALMPTMDYVLDYPRDATYRPTDPWHNKNKNQYALHSYLKKSDKELWINKDLNPCSRLAILEDSMEMLSECLDDHSVQICSLKQGNQCKKK